SALLSGRSTAIQSDLWVFRHVWDTLEQQEVLNALVHEALREAKPDPQDHPRAAGALPNAEELARDLEDLERRLGDVQTTPPQQARIPGATRYRIGEDQATITRIGRRIPEGTLPAGPWAPLATMIELHPQPAALPAMPPTKINIQLVRGESLEEPSAIVISAS